MSIDQCSHSLVSVFPIIRNAVTRFWMAKGGNPRKLIKNVDQLVMRFLTTTINGVCEYYGSFYYDVYQQSVCKPCSTLHH